ncbi:MAG: isoprenyl transferase [Gemmatimonadetes bacterium]|nr:MAG: isoprenyl transferase [Gemmatimonadota bacterium]
MATTTSHHLPHDIHPESLPKHIAIIMDGNGRWAKARNRPRIFGHRAGVDTVREIVRTCGEIGIQHLTLYTFSSENWRRPKSEVDGLMLLLQRTLAREVDELDKNNVRLSMIGRMHELPDTIQKEMTKAIRRLSHNTGLHLVLALNYGGRLEILDAVRQIATKVQQGKLAPGQINEAIIDQHLYTRNMPDPDLVIRTSGEMRVSNYLLWQIAYSEFYITDVYWPDFSPDKLFEALREYQKRSRRFGGIAAQPETESSQVHAIER